MLSHGHRFFFAFTLLLVGLVAAPLALGQRPHQIVTLRNGLEYEGLFATIPEYSEILGGGPVLSGGLDAIAMIDDGLRRIYFNYRHIAQKPVPAERPFQRIPIWQELSVGQPKSWREGILVRADPFNELGHRVVTTRSTTGGGTFVQAIIEVNPDYCRVAAVRDKDWEMRVDTAVIPSDVLIKLLRRQIIDTNNITKRLEIVDLLLQAHRYQDANAELKSVLHDFPDLVEEINAKRQILSQQFARQVLTEIRTRIENGQTELGLAMTEKIKGPEVSAEILAEILALVQSIQQNSSAVDSAKQLLEQSRTQAVADGRLAPEALAMINVTIDEILNELNVNNLDRLATFVRLAPDNDLTAAQKISFAISGWLIGSGAALDNLAVAVALVDARRLCVEYLTVADADRRAAILEELATIEAGDPNYLARIIQHLLPPNAPSAEVNLKEPLQFDVEIPGIEADGGTRFVPYAVQLPPQYDPYRRYPCIVALHAEGQSLNSQLAWWAGVYSPQLEMPIGQASRHGYIVIAPEWRQGQGRDFDFSAIEHLAVLKSLRDALRRFSIDTDRVYLAGHFGGGDAAWDIGLTFPDIWAGVIPISAGAGAGGKYAFRCHETIAGQNLGFLFVSGQHDLGRIVDNKLVWNKWMQSPNYDVMLMEYQGRLAESFAEAQPEIFRWMARHKRVFPVEEFTGRSLRPWARQYWWVEVDRLAADEVVVPVQWPPAEKILPVHFDCKFLRPQNKFIINAAKGNTATLWILPEMVDFSRNIEISGRGNDYRGPVTPNRAVLLEDVRTRGDRQHPYWAKLVCERATWRPQ